MKKICNPSLLSRNYFVLSNLLDKMTLYVSFFITSNRKLNLEALLPSRGCRLEGIIWKRSLFWLLRGASSSYEPPVLPPLSLPGPTPGKFSAAAAAKLCVTLHLFYLLSIFYLFKKLLKQLISKKKISFENNFAK